MHAARIGSAILTFRVRSANDSDAARWMIPILVPRMKETVALYESTTGDRKREEVKIPKDIYRELGNLEFTAASTAMVGLSGGISYLFEYPYGCLEQRLSRVLPMIAAKDLVEAFGFEVLKGKDHKAVVEKMLEEIPLFQRWDGGFSYWKNTPESWPYLSAYAMYGLTLAKQQGYSISTQSFDDGIRYIREVLTGKYAFGLYNQNVWYCTHAMILHTLAVNGTPDFGYMDRLYRERDKMPLFARATLLRALQAARGNRTMIDELARGLTNMAKIAPASAHFEETDEQGLFWCFHSNARTTALVLHALIETQPENTLIPKVVRWLLDAQRNGRWRTTQENLYVVQALVAYFKSYEKEEPNFTAEIQLAGGTALKALFAGRSLKTERASVKMAELQSGTTYPVDLLKTGPGRMYYGVRMNYYPSWIPVVREEGLTVTRELEGVAKDAAGTAVVKASSVMRIRLTVMTTQARNFIVLEDPVPAGFEIIQSSFRTEATQDLSEEGQREWWWSNPFRHRELGDDRALFFADYLPAGVHSVTYLVRATGIGTFGHPGARAEGMYEPEVFGQAASGSVRIE
jgi:uncharacterized protein YfaS (alpha-2-macroglobulin family)